MAGDAKPTVSVTGPEGIAFSTPKTIVSYAGVNLDTVAQQHMQMASGKRFNVNAGKGISPFLRSDGTTQIAHNGDFTLQSQHDDMKLELKCRRSIFIGGGRPSMQIPRP